MSVIALAIIVVFAMWIAGIGLFALVRPTSARAKIAQFATNWQVNLIEQLGRGAAGAALVIRVNRTHERFTPPPVVLGRADRRLAPEA